MSLISTAPTEATVPEVEYTLLKAQSEASENRATFFKNKYEELVDIVKRICDDAQSEDYDMSEWSDELKEHGIDAVPTEEFTVSVRAVYSGSIIVNLPKGSDAEEYISDLLRGELPSSIEIYTRGEEYPSYSESLEVEEWDVDKE